MNSTSCFYWLRKKRGRDEKNRYGLPEFQKTINRSHARDLEYERTKKNAKREKTNVRHWIRNEVQRLFHLMPYWIDNERSSNSMCHTSKLIPHDNLTALNTCQTADSTHTCAPVHRAPHESRSSFVWRRGKKNSSPRRRKIVWHLFQLTKR